MSEPTQPTNYDWMKSVFEQISPRDFFAAAALMRMMSDRLTIQQIAEEAYRFADAMLAARQEGGGS
jgi:hypothetical protein